MFNEIILDALKNRDARLSRLKDGTYEMIVAEARSRWVAYEPAPRECRTAGVDSSWNRRAFQGLNLYAIAAVAVTSTNEVLAKEWEDDVASSARGEQLEQKAMAMEAQVAKKAHESGRADVVCVDGSLVSRLLKDTPDMIAEAVRKYGSTIFISKTSESRSQFVPMGSRAGDIYYYRHATQEAGFSVPQDAKFRGAPVLEVYMRIRAGAPVLRIEVVKGAHETGERDVKMMMDLLRYHSVAGYPYCLKLAHKNCKISNEDIDRLASIYSLQNEQGARDALNE